MTDLLTRDQETSAAESAAAQVANQTPETPERVGRFDYKWIALAVVLTGTIMTILDATIVNIAIPTLQTDLHAGSYSDIAWVVTGYMLAQGAVIPMTGWATDRFGTKRLYLITITLFTLSSMACGLAANLPELILFRVIQGVGGGMLMPIGMTIILRAVGPQNMGKVMGIFGVPMLLAPALGPVLGGWFVQDFTWRLIFYVNVPIGIVAFISASRYLKETPTTHKLHLDTFGLLTATPAVVALMYAVDQSTSLGWSSSLVISLLVASAAFFAAFVLSQLQRRRAATLLMFPILAIGIAIGLRQAATYGWGSIDTLAMFGAAVIAVACLVIGWRESPEPLLHLELFRDGTFSWAMVLSFIIVTAMFGAMLLIPLYLQEVHGYDALQTGLMLLPQAATAAIAMPVGGMLSDRIGPRPVVIFGLVLLAGGGVLLAQIHADSPVTLVVGALLLRGFAMGFCMMPSMAAAMARVPPQFTSRASSITNSLQRIGSSIGIAVLVTILVGQMNTAVQQTSCTPPQAVVQAATTTLHQPELTSAQLCGEIASKFSGTQFAGGGAAPASSGNATLDSFVAGYAGRVLSTSFDRTFAFIAVLTIIGVIPALFLKKPEKRAQGAGGALAA